MVIDRASIFADRFQGNPQILQAAVLGQAPVPGLDPYTALRALQLIKESRAMQTAQAAQQPTEAPSLVQQAMQMPQGMPTQGAPQGMPPQAAPQGMPPQGPPQGMAGGGLAAMHVPEEDYAAGGIVAFAGDGEEGQVTNSNPLLDALESIEGSPGDPVTYQQLSSLYPGLIRQILSEAPKSMTAGERAQFVKDYIKERQTEAGPSAFEGLRREIAESRGERDKNLRQAQGMALLEAAAAAVQPGGTMRGLAGAAAAFGGSYGRALQADRAERRALANMEMNIADAERKERMGMYGEARAAAAAADRDRVEASRAHTAKMSTVANLVGKGMQATKPKSGASGRQPQPRFDMTAFAANLDNLRATEKPKEGETPEQFDARIRAAAVDITARQLKTTDVGPTRAGLTAAETARRISDAIGKELAKFKLLNTEYLRAKTPAEKKRLEEEYVRERRDFYQYNPQALDQPIAPPGAGAGEAARPAPSVIRYNEQGVRIP